MLLPDTVAIEAPLVLSALERLVDSLEFCRVGKSPQRNQSSCEPLRPRRVISSGAPRYGIPSEIEHTAFAVIDMQNDFGDRFGRRLNVN
jgi:hypothetical protein